MVKCDSCEAPIKWVTMVTGRKMPLNLPPEKRVVSNEADKFREQTVYSVVDTYISHFATCPNADQHRRKQ